jgi:hypothetical protein
MTPAYPYRFHIALDGSGLNGLEGRAGVCLFLFNPKDNSYAYNINYFDGIAGGHALSVNSSGTLGYLGNTGQHVLIYDAQTGRELARQSTLAFEPVDTSLQGSTHAVWLSDTQFVTAIGKHFYRFDTSDLSKPEILGSHDVMLPHAIKLTTGGTHLVYGSMDNPAMGADGEARMVGFFELATRKARIVKLPATCWHVATHPTEDLVHAVSFRVIPQAYRDYHDWAMAFHKEYAFEIDVASASVRRHWSASRDIPAHINSDMVVSDSELIFCNGASQTIVFIDLQSYASYRLIDERPELSQLLNNKREIVSQIGDALSRGNVLTDSRHFLSALRISRYAILDSVYACQLSADQSLLFTANRGLNHVTIYDYPSNEIVLRVKMPDLQEYVDAPPRGDRRLGFHHGWLCG